MCRARTILLMAITLGACRTTRAPDGFALPPDVAARTAVGSWVEVEGFARDSTIIAMGELISISRDTVILFDADTLATVPMARVGRIRVARYAVDHDNVAIWTVGGLLSTVSHGWFLVISAPIWIGTGTATAVVDSRRAIDITSDVERIRPYARFPQGIPPIVDRSKLVVAIRPKPSTQR